MLLVYIEKVHRLLNTFPIFVFILYLSSSVHSAFGLDGMASTPDQLVALVALKKERSPLWLP
jgi:hypothetical protein